MENGLFSRNLKMLSPDSFKWFIPLALKFKLHEHHNLNPHYNAIINKYDIERKQFLGNKEQCRYCKAYNKNINSIREKLNRGELEHEKIESFKKIAHSLPTLIGNVNIISKDECDTCNEKFSKLEENLVSFLGITRTTNKIQSRNGIPKSKINKHEFVDISSEGDLIICSYENSDMIDETDNIITITTKKKYIPTEVHKCFVKMALAVIPLDKLQYFTKTIHWILGEVELDDNFSKQLYVWQTKWPIRNMFPYVSIDVYERKFDRIDIPFMFARVCFNNYAFQFPIPCCSMDLLVNNFNMPAIIKNESPFPELVANNALWKKILNDTTVKKISLSNKNKIEEIDRQSYMAMEKTSSAKIEELPDEIKKYLEKNKLIK
ncbi:hypothetical protein [Aeromonas veronii]|uniref:hypothetical protein n=1 Tax=Aeromonas veronii TaxID=654 RepID=UPI003311DED0|nr:hypothetical protein [Aeromonas veronii]